MNKKEILLLVGSNLWYFGEGMLGPLFAVFTERVGGDILEISWAWALYLMIMGLLVIVIGKISDEWLNKSKLMMAGYALNALFTFGYLLVSKPSHLFIIQAGLGVAAAFAIPTWSALYAKHEDRNHAGFAWGLVSGIDKILMAIALFIGGLIITFLSFDFLFITMGIIQVIATLYQAQILFYEDPKIIKKKIKARRTR